MSPTRRSPSLHRTALCLSLSTLMLAGLVGCDRRGSTDGTRTNSTTNSAPAAPASAASR